MNTGAENCARDMQNVYRHTERAIIITEDSYGGGRILQEAGIRPFIVCFSERDNRSVLSSGSEIGNENS